VLASDLRTGALTVICSPGSRPRLGNRSNTSESRQFFCYTKRRSATVPYPTAPSYPSKQVWSSPRTENARSQLKGEKCTQHGPLWWRVSDAGQSWPIRARWGPASESLPGRNPRGPGDRLPYYGDLTMRRPALWMRRPP